jgi:WD40 repeat protein/energy-coupling factor transporter ATP-binding protein EcfA2
MAEKQFDVFLSHNSKDRQTVQRIAAKLREAGFRPWLDVWELTGGGEWQKELEAGLRSSRAFAVLVGPNGLSGWVEMELAVALDRAAKERDFRLFLVLLPDLPDPFDPASLPAFLNTRGWVDLREGFEDQTRFQSLINAILGIAHGEPALVPSDGAITPYRGLEAFNEEHAEFFFGREANVQRMLEKLKGSRFLAVVGPSGSGKSSLVRAGLVPALKNGRLQSSESWPIVVFTPGGRPLTSLATVLVRLDAARAMGRTLDELQSDSRSLDLASSLVLAASPSSARLVIVVDQFEEVFTLCQSDDERRWFFGNLLNAATTPNGRCIVVFTMRADFYPRCAAYPELAALISARQELVGPLDEDGLRSVIVEPAWKAGLQFEDGLVATILDDISRQPGALPLLQHALLELWERRRGTLLTLEGYRASGGVSGAIANRADTIFDHLESGEQRLARRLMLRLTQPGEGTEDTRRRAQLGELVTQEDDHDSVETVVNRLVEARLLTTSIDQTTGSPQVDVAHEALIRAWPRLRLWLDENRESLRAHRRLTDAANEWDRLNRDDGMLYRGVRLAEAIELADRDPAAMNDRERSFVAESVALREREQADIEEQQRAKERAQRRVLAGLTVGIVLVLGFALVAWNQRGQTEMESANRAIAVQTAEAAATEALDAQEIAEAEATRAIGAEATAEAERNRAQAEAQRAIEHQETAEAERRAAERQQREAEEARQRAIAATMALFAERESDPFDSTVLFALEAYQRDPMGQESSVILPRMLQLNPKLTGFLQDPATLSLTGASCFLDDGAMIAAKAADGAVVLWQLATRQPVTRLGGGQSGSIAPGGIACSLDGEQIASWDDEGNVTLWNTSTFRVDSRLSGDVIGGTPDGMAFSPDGRTLTAVVGGNVVSWDVAGLPSSPTALATLDERVSSVVYSDDGHWMALATENGNIYMVESGGDDSQPGEPLRRSTSGKVQDLAFSPDGRHLATVTEQYGVELWDLDTRESSLIWGEEGSELLSWGEDIEFSLDGRRLLVSSSDGVIYVVDWETGEMTEELQYSVNAGATVGGLEFSPDGSVLASTIEGHALALWRIDDPNSRIGQWLPDSQLSVQWPSEETELVNFVNGVAVSPDGTTLATARWGGSVVLWDLSTLLCVDVLSPAGFPPQDCKSPVILPDGEPATWPGHGLQSLSFSRNGELLAAGYPDGHILLWDLTAKRLVGQLSGGHQDITTGLAFSADGTILASVGFDGFLIFWDVASQRMLGEPIRVQDAGTIPFLAASPSGRTLAIAGANGLAIWDMESQQHHDDLVSDRSVDTVVFEGESRLFEVSWSSDITLWNLSTGQTEPTSFLSDQTQGSLFAIALSPEYLAAAGRDGKVFLYSREVRRAAFSLGHSVARIRQLVFTPDHRRLIVATEGGVVVWEIDKNALVTAACQLANRNLTRREWQNFFVDEPYRKTCPDLPEPVSIVATPEPIGTLPAPVGTPQPGASPVAVVS